MSLLDRERIYWEPCAKIESEIQILKRTRSYESKDRFYRTPLLGQFDEKIFFFGHLLELIQWNDRFCRYCGAHQNKQIGTEFWLFLVHVVQNISVWFDIYYVHKLIDLHEYDVIPQICVSARSTVWTKPIIELGSASDRKRWKCTRAYLRRTAEKPSPIWYEFLNVLTLDFEFCREKVKLCFPSWFYNL